MMRLIAIALLLPLGIMAQTKTTQETQIVVAVDTQKNEIDALYPLAYIKEDSKALESCATCKHFLGTLSGAFELNQSALSPMAGATIKVFKEQEVFSGESKFPDLGLATKKEVVLGNGKAKIVENKKGELILKTKNNEN